MTEPDFTPRAEGVEAAIRAGRRRRTTRQLGSGGAAAALALVAVLVTTHPFSTAGSSDSLRVAGEPGATSSATPDPAAGNPSAEPSAQPTSSASPDTGSGGGATPGDGSGNGYGDASASPDASTSPDTPDRVSAEPTHSTVAYKSNASCTQPPVSLNTDVAWCVFYSGDTSVKRGGSADITVDFCRLPGFGSGQWDFGDADGVEMDVTNGSGDIKWTSRDGRKVAQTKWSATIAESTCLRLATTWDTRDRDGFRVRPGDYNVDYSYTGGPTSGSSTGTSGDTITVTS